MEVGGAFAGHLAIFLRPGFTEGSGANSVSTHTLPSLANSVMVREGAGDQQVNPMVRRAKRNDRQGHVVRCSQRSSGHEWVRFEGDNKEVGTAGRRPVV